MKKIKFAAAALAAVIMLTGCGNNTDSSSAASDSGASSAVTEKTPADLTAQLLEAVDFPEMAEVTADKLVAYYGFEESDISDYSAYIAGAGVYPDEFGVFIAVDSDAAEKIYDCLLERKDKQQDIYKDYSPEEADKYTGSFVMRTGNKVIFCVCADNDTAMSILN